MERRAHDELARRIERDRQRNGDHGAAQLVTLRAFEAQDEQHDPRLIEPVEVVRPRDRPERGDIDREHERAEPEDAAVGWLTPQHPADDEVVDDEQPDSGEGDPLGRPRRVDACDGGGVRHLVGTQRDAEPADPPERALVAARALCARGRDLGDPHGKSIGARRAFFR